MPDEGDPAGDFSVPADLEHFDLFDDALGYFAAAGHDESARHQVKRAAWRRGRKRRQGPSPAEILSISIEGDRQESADSRVSYAMWRNFRRCRCGATKPPTCN